MYESVMMIEATPYWPPALKYSHGQWRLNEGSCAPDDAATFLIGWMARMIAARGHSLWKLDAANGRMCVASVYVSAKARAYTHESASFMRALATVCSRVYQAEQTP